MERVHSKHLFNFQLNGILDKHVAEWIEKATQIISPEMQDPAGRTCEEYIAAIRTFMDNTFVPIGKHPILAEAVENCTHSKFEVPARDSNDFAVPVLIHTPKNLEGQQNKAAIIYAHGGGAVGGSAKMFQPWLSKFAVTCGVVYFNVDYRLAPETKCPNNVLDFYCAIKHVVEHASEYGIDPNKIAIAGDSGGGYITMGAMVMLAQKNEGHLIKLAMPGIPMIDDYEFGDPKSMTTEERGNVFAMKKVWECIATDLDAQRKNGDPLLFPAKASDELLAKFPPTIIWEHEFDFFITQAIRMAMRLRRVGRLLELYILPGAMHDSTIEPGTALFEQELRDMKHAVDNYLL